MSSVLYYSNYCSYSKNILLKLSRSKVKSQLHFLCVDKRIKIDGKIYLILENGDKILMPESITKVPALMLLYRNNELLFGDDIHKHFDVIIKNNEVKNDYDPRTSKTEPESFSLSDVAGSVKSDFFSFIDMSQDELSAKGDGGTRMLYNYCTLNNNETINTPPDDYTPNKVNDTEIKNYQEAREQVIQRN